MRFIRSIRKSCASIFSFKRLLSVSTKGATGLSEPSAPIPGRFPHWSNKPSELFADLKDGDTVFLQGVSCTPDLLTRALVDHVLERNLKNLKLFQFFPLGETPYLRDELKGRIRMTTAFASKYCRDAVNDGISDFIPITIADLPTLYRKRLVEFDYALIMVSAPDKHGFCSLGSAVGSARSAIQNAKRIVAQVNPLAPVTYGDSAIHTSQIDFLSEGSQPLFEMAFPRPSAVEQKIASIIAQNLIDSGATMQLGYGTIPVEITNHLRDHKNLGVHTECIFDGLIDLVNLGVVTNKHKPVRQGRIVGSYALGTKQIYNFINENPLVGLFDIAWTNSTERIARNPKVTAVNACLEMDLTGQSVGDGIGGRLYTGVGGQLDFIRGACLSSDGLGRPIITMTSMTKEGTSAIVPTLGRNSTVVATRAHVHYVVTEYGIAYLFGKTLRQRAYELIKIAHPDFRESLEKAAFDRLKTMPAP